VADLLRGAASYIDRILRGERRTSLQSKSRADLN
jgi:hypothetical protein